MYFNVNVAFQDGSIHDMSLLKWGDYKNTWHVPSVPASSRQWTWCNWVNRCPQETGED